MMCILIYKSIYLKTIMKEIEQHNKERLKAVTNFLKWYRINSGLTQHELGLSSNYSRSTIATYETNPHNLTLLTIFEIADALELDINQLFLEIK